MKVALKLRGVFHLRFDMNVLIMVLIRIEIINY